MAVDVSVIEVRVSHRHRLWNAGHRESGVVIERLADRTLLPSAGAASGDGGNTAEVVIRRCSP